MSVKTNIKDFYGRVIGTVVEENNGDKTIKDFYGRPLGYYKKGRNVTTDFYGRVVASASSPTSFSQAASKASPSSSGNTLLKSSQEG